VLDPVIDEFKRNNKGKKDAIVEEDDENPTSKLGKAVPASQIGLTADDWDASLELEAFLDHPFQIKETIEHKGYCTGAQGLYLVHDLIKGCADDKSLTVKLFPKDAKLESRKRELEVREGSDLYSLTTTARQVLAEECQSRFFGERPSNLRLVQMWMSKQRAPEKWMPQAWQVLAKGLYLKMLRAATKIAGIGEKASPCKKQKTAAAASSSSLVRNLSSDEDELAGTEEGGMVDVVTSEAELWKNIDKATIREFTDKEGLVNEFALVYKMRQTCPLHYIVFKQVSSHLGHEANSEQLFSQSGKLSDDNGKMDPHRLAVWTSIGVNRSIYEPSTKQIMERYFLKFSKGGKTVHDDDLGLVDTGSEVNAADDGGYYARWGEPQPQNLGADFGTRIG
jgi:hypothetical protein